MGGNKPNTAGRLFNLLSKAHTLAEIEHLRNVHQDCLNPNHLDYLNSVPDNSQFPAARCAMGTDIYMYHRSAGLEGESMNHANAKMRDRTAVDCLNLALLLLKMEGD